MRSNNRTSNRYTKEQVHDLIRDLKLIQKPREPGDKLNIEEKRIDSEGYTTRLWRTIWYSKEGRQSTVKFIENRIDFAFRLVMEYIPQKGLDHHVNAGTPARNAQLRRKLDSEYINELVEHIAGCVNGIENLRNKTYIGDDKMATRLDGILTDIDVKLESCRDMLSSALPRLPPPKLPPD